MILKENSFLLLRQNRTRVAGECLSKTNAAAAADCVPFVPPLKMPKIIIFTFHANFIPKRSIPPEAWEVNQSEHEVALLHLKHKQHHRTANKTNISTCSSARMPPMDEYYERMILAFQSLSDNEKESARRDKICFASSLYSARKKSLYMVARNFFLLLLNRSAWPCLGPS